MDKATIAVFNDTKQPIDLLSVKIPVPTAGQILVKNEYVTLCKSDINTFLGKRVEKTPTILGHEIVGRIVSFGTDAHRFDLRGEEIKAGDRITWAIYAANPASEMAQKGIPQKSHDLVKYGHEQITEQNNFHGGLSDYIILRQNTPIAKISEEVPVQLAAIINCSVATIAGALRLAGEIKNKRVLISGVGMLGIIACAMCNTLGASDIFVLDIDSDRIQKAMQFGANAGALITDELHEIFVSRYNGPAPFDIVIELSGVPTLMEDTLQMLGIGGITVWVGATYPSRNTQINAEKIIRNLWTIKGLHNYNSKDFITAVNFIETNYNKFPFRQLIFDKFSLCDINSAFEYAIIHNPHRVGIKI